MTNSSLPQPPRTSANWPRSFLHRSKRAKPDRKGTRAGFGTAISALANVSFSTESADSRPSPQQRAIQAVTLEADIQTTSNTGLALHRCKAVSSRIDRCGVGLGWLLSLFFRQRLPADKGVGTAHQSKHHIQFGLVERCVDHDEPLPA